MLVDVLVCECVLVRMRGMFVNMYVGVLACESVSLCECVNVRFCVFECVPE